MEKREILLDIRVRASDVQKQLEGVNKRLAENANSLAVLKKQLKEGLDFDEFNKAQTAIRLDSADLRKEAASLTRQLQNQTRAANAAEGSNEQLKAQLSLLTQQYNNLSKANRENAEIGGKLTIQTRKLSDEIKANEAAIGNNTRNVGNYKSALEGVGSAILAPAGLLFGLNSLTDAARQVVTVFASFSQQVATLQAVSGATAEEVARLEADARRLGETTKFTASEVAGLQIEFARVGFKPDQILAATEATLNLAVATGEDLPRAAEVAAATLGGYGLSADQTARVTDVMAESFNASALDLERFAEATKFVAPVARIAGVSIEDVTGALGALADAGLSGSNAGTGLRRVLAGLSDENSALAKQVGFAVTNSDEFSRALQILGQRGISNAEAIKLVGRDASSVLSVLVESSEKALALGAALDSAGGAAEKAADIMRNTLQGDIDNLTSSFEGLIINIGSGLESVLRSTVQAITTFILSLSEIPKFIQENKEEILLLGAAIVTLNASQIAASLSALRLAAAQKGAAIATRAAAVAQAALNVVMNANPITLVVTAVLALGAAFSALYKRSEEVRAGVAGTFAAVKVVFDNFVTGFVKQFTGLGDVLAGAFTLDVDRIKKGLSEIGSGYVQQSVGIGEGAGKAFSDAYNAEIEEGRKKAEVARAAAEQEETDKAKARRGQAVTGADLILDDEGDGSIDSSSKKAQKEADEAAKSRIEAEKKALEELVALEELGILRLTEVRRSGLVEAEKIDAEEIDRKKRKIDIETQLALVGLELESAEARLIVAQAEEEKLAIVQEFQQKQIEARRAGSDAEKQILADQITESVRLESEALARRQAAINAEIQAEIDRAARLQEIRQNTVSAIADIENAAAQGDVVRIAEVVDNLVKQFQEGGISAKEALVSGIGGAAGAIAGVLQQVQGLIEVNDRESAERARKVQIAQLIFSGISSAAQALFRSISQFGLPLGAIVGGIASGVIGGITAAQVSALRSQPLGFADGGFTGGGLMPDPKVPGRKIAGVVHDREYVVPTRVMERPEGANLVQQLEGLRVRSYAQGGFVGLQPRIAQAESSFNLADSLMSSIARLPNPVVSVVEINKAQTRVIEKQMTGSL